MKRTIRVAFGEAARVVGNIYHTVDGAREHAAFEYDKTWLERADRFAIDPALPLVRGPQYNARTPDGSIFHSVIADSEPDGWARQVIRRDHAKRRAVSREAGNNLPPLINNLDFLLEVSDASRVGALRFQDERGQFCRTVEPGKRVAPPLIELGALFAATRAVETNTETAADLAYLRGNGTSLGGMRPKCTVMEDDGTLSIGKFPSVGDERAVTKGEVLAMQLAGKAGISAASARIVNSDDTPVAVIKRFDRQGTLRVMYCSAATLLGARTNDAVNYTYTDIAAAIRSNGADVKMDLEELWRRIAFSILINNVDDHLRNHGFLHVELGKWKLSPAFDINPFPERTRELKTWISEESGPTASIAALMASAQYFSVSKQRAKQILAVVNRAVKTWRSHARKIGMTVREADAFADAFESDERKVVERTLKA